MAGHCDRDGIARTHRHGVLYTHVYFAQLLIGAIPLADPRFRRAVQRCPAVSSGCSPGPACPTPRCVCRYARAQALGTTISGAPRQRMLAGREDDESRARSRRATRDLLADIIAKNTIVPAHGGCGSTTR